MYSKRKKSPLHFIFIVNCSGSMAEGKIHVLNCAISESICAIQNAVKDAEEYPWTPFQALIRAVKFSDVAQWHVENPVPVEDFNWPNLAASVSDEVCTGKALSMVAEQLKMPPMEDRGVRPVLVLVSDGESTDDVSEGLKNLMDQAWGQMATRIALAVGSDANLDPLQRFIGHPEVKPFSCNNVDNICNRICFWNLEYIRIYNDYISIADICERELYTLPRRINTGSSAEFFLKFTELYPFGPIYHRLTVDRQLSAEILKFELNSPDEIVAEVVRHPNDAQVLGLKNLSHRTWEAKLANGSIRQVETGRSVKLSAGTRINFGTVEGEIIE
jgi:uncharacterized protein YegL